MQTGHEMRAVRNERRLFSQIKEFARFRDAKCTYSRILSMNDLQRAMRRPGGACVIGSVTVSQAGASEVVLFRGAETHTRSVLKAISWRTLGTTTPLPSAGS
jgi:hypothetical protein